MSRERKREKNPLTTLAESAALEPEEAGLSARGGGPVGRPAWAPGDVDLIKVPEPVRHAVVEIIEPAYRRVTVHGAAQAVFSAPCEGDSPPVNGYGLK